MCEPNRIQEIIRPKGIKQIGDSIWLVDMGKALNGWVELSFPKLPEGHRVRMEYTDWLNENEDFKPQGRTDSMRIGISVPDKAKRYSEINLTTMRFNI